MQLDQIAEFGSFGKASEYPFSRRRLVSPGVGVWPMQTYGPKVQTRRTGTSRLPHKGPGVFCARSILTTRHCASHPQPSEASPASSSIERLAQASVTPTFGTWLVTLNWHAAGARSASTLRGGCHLRAFEQSTRRWVEFLAQTTSRSIGFEVSMSLEDDQLWWHLVRVHATFCLKSTVGQCEQSMLALSVHAQFR
jgi:hypothetical protein